MGIPVDRVSPYLLSGVDGGLMKKKVVALFVALLFPVLPSHGQTYGLPGSQPIDPVGYYINQSFWSNKAFTTVMRNSLMRSGQKGRTGAQQKPANIPAGATAFKHSGGHMLPVALAAAHGGGSGDTAAEKRIVEDLLNLYRKTATTDGFPPDDLAYAFEYFVVNNYHVFHYLLDVNTDPALAKISDPLARLQAINARQQMKVTLSQERAIYDQFRAVLSENADVKKLTDAQKQEATEMLAVLTGMAYLQFSKGWESKSAEQMEKGRQTARANLEKLTGGSVESVKITNNGLEF